MKAKYIIIGGGAAGMAAARSISGLDPGEEIIMLSDEKVRPYFRPMIPYIISGKMKLEDFLLEGMGPYTDTRVNVKVKSRVDSVAPGKKRVTAGGKEYEYDKLLISTGSRPKIPKEIKGTGAEGVYTLRFYSDARDMAKRISKGGHAVMAGGGLLNLKAAFALREKGIEVTLVVTSPAILSQLMEPDDSYLLKKAIEDAGIRILAGNSVEEIVAGRKGVKSVKLSSGGSIACGLVCIGKGVEPVIDYLEGSGIGIDTGVVANEYTETGTEGVYAAGDVAVTYNPVSGEPVVTGLWTNAAEMGRCAGANMAGVKTSYPGTLGILNATQIGDLPFVSMGMVHSGGTDLETHIAAFKNSYRKLVFSGDGKNLVGAVFIGDITNAGLYRYLIRENKPIGDIKSDIIKQKLHYGHFMKVAEAV
jgi:NAD(P)H-nitrite reductase large subunit